MEPRCTLASPGEYGGYATASRITLDTVPTDRAGGIMFSCCPSVGACLGGDILLTACRRFLVIITFIRDVTVRSLVFTANCSHASYANSAKFQPLPTCMGGLPYKHTGNRKAPYTKGDSDVVLFRIYAS